MPARLIVNADDFGLTPGINRAIAELHDAGVLTSATLMANGPAFADAVDIALARPTLGTGCHIVLTDGTPISPPTSIPSLLGPDHRTFHPTLSTFLTALALNRIRPEDILREALAQIEKLQATGLRLTHIDTHKHTHIFPSITGPLLEAARRTGVPAIRNPFEPAWSRSLHHGSTTRRLILPLVDLLYPRFNAQPAISSRNILTTDGTAGISATGSLNASTLAQQLQALPPSGTFELCCHPGYNDADLALVRTVLRAHRDTERQALLAELPRALAQPNAPTLIHYRDLATTSA